MSRQEFLSYGCKFHVGSEIMPVLISSLFSKSLHLEYNGVTEQKMEKGPFYFFTALLI